MDIKHMELPLVFFTVMSQWGIGAVFALTIYQMKASKENLLSGSALRRVVLLIWLIEVVGSSMSMGHLGVPLEAYRSVLGLGHSWLSREAVTFVLLNGVVTLWALSCWLSPQVNVRNQLLGWLSAIGGVAAIFVTAQVYYQMIAHPLWHTPATQIAFIGSAIVLGFSLVTLLINEWTRKTRSISYQNWCTDWCCIGIRSTNHPLTITGKPRRKLFALVAGGDEHVVALYRGYERI